VKGGEEGAGELVVSGCDGAVDFEMTDHALDPVALLVDAAVPADLGGARGSRWDDWPDAAFGQVFADRIGVVGFVAEEMARRGVGLGHHVRERRAVGRFAGREVEDEWDAAGVTETMNLTGEPAPRASKSLFASPPFAPAAEICPRTVVLSMLWRELSAIPWAKVVATVPQIPARLQRRKRWYTVIHLPYFSGTSRQGAPVRMRHKMPLTIFRLSLAGRFLRPLSGGSRSFNRRHSASERSPRLKIPSLQERILESKLDSTVNQFVNRA
jgi:hypothetical protein